MAPTGNHEPLTEDTDFLGSAEDARWLCKLLGRDATEIVLAKDFDPSPNSAIAYIQRPDGRILMIDFLRAIVGVRDQDVRAMAVPVEVAGNLLHVLHPLLCLKSRLANLEKLSSKRNTNGVMQAHWAIDIVRAYLLHLLDTGAPQRDLIQQFSMVSELAEFGSGPFCFQEYKIDPLTAISDDMVARVGTRFVTDDWPRKLARIAQKRARYPKLIMKIDMSQIKAGQSMPWMTPLDLRGSAVGRAAGTAPPTTQPPTT